MIQLPIFSTWAKYSRDVNEAVVLKFSKEIYNHGYDGVQFELDDFWEVMLLYFCLFYFYFSVINTVILTST